MSFPFIAASMTFEIRRAKFLLYVQKKHKKFSSGQKNHMHFSNFFYHSLSPNFAPFYFFLIKQIIGNQKRVSLSACVYKTAAQNENNANKSLPKASKTKLWYDKINPSHGILKIPPSLTQMKIIIILLVYHSLPYSFIKNCFGASHITMVAVPLH